MNDYVFKHSVPVLDEHTLTHEGEDGGEVEVQLTEARLREIADRNNRRAAETGDWCPIVIGHTKDDAPEESQPEIVGYAGNWKVEPFARTGRKALTATFKFFRNAVDKARRFPRRSVELWLSDWKIDPIALLGATTPERDLGLLRLSKGGPRVSYSRVNDDMMNDAPTGVEAGGGQSALVQALLTALQQTAPFKWVEQKMAEEQAMNATPPPPEAGMGMDPSMMPPPDEFGDGDYEDDEDDVHIDIDSHNDDEDDDDEEEDDEEEPVQYAASSPSGSNTYCPPASPVKKKTMSRQHADRPISPAARLLLDRIRMAADQRRAEHVKLSRALAHTHKENQELRLRFQRAERERDLVQLELEGIMFDRAEELDAVTGLSEEKYKSHLDRMRKRYQKAPVGRPAWSAPTLRSANGVKGRDKDGMNKVLDYATQNGLTYEQALDKLGEA